MPPSPPTAARALRAKREPLFSSDAQLCVSLRSFTYEVTDDGKATNLITHGTDHCGQTVCATITNFYPYLYLSWGTEQPDRAKVVDMLLMLSRVMAFVALQKGNGGVKRAGWSVPDPIHEWRAVKRMSVRALGDLAGYQQEETWFIQVWMIQPAYISMARRIMEFVLANPRANLAAVAEAARNRGFADKSEPNALKKAVSTVRKLGKRWWGKEESGAKEAEMDEVEMVVRHEDYGQLRRNVLKEGEEAELDRLLQLGILRGCNVYEADIDFVVRYLADALYSPEEWVEIRNATIVETPHANAGQLTVTVDWRNVTRARDEVQQVVPHQYILSVDAEMESCGNFPDAKLDRVLQICCVALNPVVDPKVHSYQTFAFVLGTVKHDAAPHETIWEFEDEGTMLEQFSQFVALSKPDAITGWNVEGFDFKYFLERAEHLKLRNFVPMARDEKQLKIRTKIFSSSAHGTHVETEVTGTGLWMWDLYKTFKRSTDFKLRSYKLDAVASHFLGERKQDLGYEEIPELQKTPEGRGRLMRYCIQDALLPGRLIGNRKLLTERIELAKNTGVPIDMVCRRGLQIRIAGLLYREVQRKRLPYCFWTRSQADRDASADDSYQGATVLDPVKGIHDEPVIVLDFKALYPSIMITYNLCTTTKLEMAEARRLVAEGTLKQDDLWWFEDWQVAFVKSHIKVGLLPMIVANLLDLRQQAKNDKKAALKANDELLASIYDQRQLAIKMNANSSYGCKGAPSSKFYDSTVAAIITFMGRTLIEKTKNACTRVFTRANGYPFDAKVIYGDTDSVFVKVSKEVTVDLFGKYGEEMADYVTKMFQKEYGVRPDNVIVLEFEKVYWPFLLYGKKRYAAKHWEFDKNGEMACKGTKTQGMETVRRDNCRLVGETVHTVLEIMLRNDAAMTPQVRRAQIQQYLAGVVAQIRSGDISYHKLIESKQLRMLVSEYREGGKTVPIHVELAAKLARRYGEDSPMVPKSGERIPFVVVAPSVLGIRTSLCGENPRYAWKHKLPLNQEHYIDHAIYGVMARLLEPLLFGNFVFVDENERKRKRLEGVKDFIATNQRGSAPITAKRARKSMFGSFSRKLQPCAICSVLCATSICANHPPAEIEAFRAREANVHRQRQEERAKLWRTCQACLMRCEEDSAQIGPVPDLEDLDVATPCESNDCQVLWDRLLNDRQTEPLRRR